MSSPVPSIGSLVSSASQGITANNGLSTGFQLIPQSERLFTMLPRESLAGQQQNFASLYIRNSKQAKPTNYQSLTGLEKALTNKAVGFASFLLESYSFAQSERSQLTPVFGGGIVAYFFGQNPITLTLQGNIPDDVDNQWFIQFAAAYQEFLRGTQLARRNEELVFLLPNMSVGGAILDLQYNQDSTRWVDIPFTATILVRTLQYRPVIYGGQINAPQLFTGTQGLQPSLSYSAINMTKALVAELGIGASVPPETAAVMNSGVIAPSNIVPQLNGGAATPSNQIASLSISSTLMNLQQGLLPGGNGMTGGSSAWLTNAFSSVSGFLRTFSGYITDVQSYIQSAIQDSGLGSFISLLDTAGGDLNSVISTVSGLVGQTSSTVAEIVGTVVSIPADLLTPFESPLYNLANLKGTFSDFVDQLLALPQTVTSYEQSTLNQFVSAAVPLASAPLFAPGGGTNTLTLAGGGIANISAGASGSGVGTSLGTGTAPTGVSLGTGVGAGAAINEPAML